jgi:Cohesin domain
MGPRITVLLLVMALGVLTLCIESSAAQSEKAVVFDDARIDDGSKTVIVSVRVRQAVEVASYQFVATFDPNVLKLRTADNADFITSTGRKSACPDPTSQTGAVRAACVTLGATPAAATGDGVLSTLTFDSLNKGDAQFNLTLTKLVHVDGTTQDLDVQSSSFIAGSSSKGRFASTPLRVAVGLAGMLIVTAIATFSVRFLRRPNKVASEDVVRYGRES